LREVVVHGIVEVMDDHQLNERTHSLHNALGRLSAARELRGLPEELPANGGSLAIEETPPVRRAQRTRSGLFSFGERGRRSLDA
jgi:hypothetical protein